MKRHGIKAKIRPVLEFRGTGRGFRQVFPFRRSWKAFVILVLFVSHGLSFFQNFIGRGEYKHRTFKDQMGEPYTRIALMHFTLIIGGGVALALGSPTPVLLLVIAGKIWFDLRAHIREHDKPA